MSELQDKLMASAYIISLDPGDEFDMKIAYETGMMVLLNKPILVIVTAGREGNAGLERIAHVIVTLTEPIETVASQLQIQAGIAQLQEMFPDG